MIFCHKDAEDDFIGVKACSPGVCREEYLDELK
jgi:hypothetical protein